MGAHKHNPTAQAVARGEACCSSCGTPLGIQATPDRRYVHGVVPVSCKLCEVRAQRAYVERPRMWPKTAAILGMAVALGAGGR